MGYTSDSGLGIGKAVVYQRPAYVITWRLVGHTDAGTCNWDPDCGRTGWVPGHKVWTLPKDNGQL